MRNLGIKFTDKVNDKAIFNFEETKTNYSLFYRGIIFINILSSANALNKLLNITNLSFNNIIVFDSQKTELLAIDNILRTVDTDYYGVKYLAITHFNTMPEQYVVKFQQQSLIKTGKWFEDDVAKELIKKQN